MCNMDNPSGRDRWPPDNSHSGSGGGWSQPPSFHDVLKLVPGAVAVAPDIPGDPVAQKKEVQGYDFQNRVGSLTEHLGIRGEKKKASRHFLAATQILRPSEQQDEGGTGLLLEDGKKNHFLVRIGVESLAVITLSFSTLGEWERAIPDGACSFGKGERLILRKGKE